MSSMIASLTHQQLTELLVNLGDPSYQNILQAFGIKPSSNNYALLHARLTDLGIDLAATIERDYYDTSLLVKCIKSQDSGGILQEGTIYRVCKIEKAGSKATTKSVYYLEFGSTPWATDRFEVVS